MSRTCSRSDCDIALGMPCEMGNREAAACSYYSAGVQASVAIEPMANVVEDASGIRLPWTGRALGLADIILAASRGRASLVGVIAPFNAGKTGLLTAIYSHLAQTGQAADFNFAGSFSLQAWNELKNHTAWPSLSNGTFPPHTPDNGQRTPGLLHLAFRAGDNPIRDVLFTDAPGEWFTRWLTNEAAEHSAGARWIAENATHFIYVVDREGLAGDDVGPIRQNTLALARLLAEHLLGRPVIAVWTKSDKQCDEEVEAPMRARLVELFGKHVSLNLHVHDPACLDLINLVLKKLEEAPWPKPQTARTSAFLAYEGART